MINAIDKIEQLQFVSDVYLGFNSLLSTCGHQNENMRNFQTSFEAQLFRCDAHIVGSIPDALVALMLIGSPNVDDNQRLLILAATVTSFTVAEDTKLGVTDMLSAVQYSSITSVLRQCDRKRSQTNECDGGALNVNGAHGSNRGRGNGNGGGRFHNRFKRHKNPDEIAELEEKKMCHNCRRHGNTKYGHWFPDHNEYGS